MPAAGIAEGLASGIVYLGFGDALACKFLAQHCLMKLQFFGHFAIHATLAK